MKSLRQKQTQRSFLLLVPIPIQPGWAPLVPGSALAGRFPPKEPRPGLRAWPPKAEVQVLSSPLCQLHPSLWQCCPWPRGCQASIHPQSCSPTPVKPQPSILKPHHPHTADLHRSQPAAACKGGNSGYFKTLGNLPYRFPRLSN